jgi:hypothetical protein
MAATGVGKASTVPVDYSPAGCAVAGILPNAVVLKDYEAGGR